MDEALNLVRRELGQDAIVVDSKEISTRRMLPWPSLRQEVEVVAELKSVHPTHRQPTSIDSKKAEPIRTIRTLAETMSQPPRELFAPIPEFGADLAAISKDLFASNDTRPPHVPSRTTMPQDRNDRVVVQQDRISSGSIVDSLQSILDRLEQKSRSIGSFNIPSELAPSYRQLVEAEVSDEIARELIAKLSQHAGLEMPKSPASMTAALTAIVEREMRCAPPIQPRAGCREIVTVVGPTGVGKTTTIAKLAGRFALQDGLRVGLITVDTYRVAAIEQLRTYAEILQIPLQTATDPNELRAAIDQMDQVDVILIDTAGRSPRDRGQMQELVDLTAVAASSHVMLVLSLAAGGLLKIADSFSAVSPTSLVVTKLDECQGCGGLLTVARDIPYPIRYLTTGQDVPEQIEPAHPNRLARLIIGRDQIQREITR